MNRRAFLKALAATGATALAASIPLEALPEEIPTTLAPAASDGFLLLTHFWARGNAETARVASILLGRATDFQNLCKFDIQASGGCMLFSPPIGYELVFPGGQLPYVRCDDPDIEWAGRLLDEKNRESVIFGKNADGHYAVRIRDSTLQEAVDHE